MTKSHGRNEKLDSVKVFKPSMKITVPSSLLSVGELSNLLTTRAKPRSATNIPSVTAIGFALKPTMAIPFSAPKIRQMRTEMNAQSHKFKYR